MYEKEIEMLALQNEVLDLRAKLGEIKRAEYTKGRASYEPEVADLKAENRRLRAVIRAAREALEGYES